MAEREITLSRAELSRLDVALAVDRIRRSAIKAKAHGHYDRATVGAWLASYSPSQAVLLDFDPNEVSLILAETKQGDPESAVGFALRHHDILRALYVHEDALGQGVGSQLLTEIELDARRAKISQLTLTAALNSVAFYQRHGYTPGRIRPYRFPSGEQMDVLDMAKRLDLPARLLRRATEDDLEEIHTIRESAVVTTCAPHYSNEQIAAWLASDQSDLIEGVLDGSLDGDLYLALLDETPLAYGLRVEEFIRALYTHPRAHGHGLGSLLLTELSHATRDAGYPRVHLNATANAVDFYTRRGFQNPHIHTHTFPCGQTLDLTRMDKPV